MASSNMMYNMMQQQIQYLQQLGFQVELRGNILLLKYPRHLIEAEILRQVTVAIPPQLRSRVRVRAEGDIVVEVVLT